MSFSLPRYHAPDFAALGLDAAPDVRLAAVEIDGVAPENYHATTMFPEYYRIGGRWILAPESRMDCVVVLRGGQPEVVEFRNLRRGDQVVLGRSEDGREGVFVHPDGFGSGEEGAEAFSFRQSRSRETAYSIDYDTLYEQLAYDRAHGNILWVMGPACAFDADTRSAFAALIRRGYVHGLMAGNALATHDLEASYRGTALGQDIYRQRTVPGGHYNHIDTINAVRRAGSIPAFIRAGGAMEGIMYECVRNGVPFVLTGSIRDDGPLPEVYADVYAGQDAMRALVRRATTVVCMTSALHTIATGT